MIPATITVQTASLALYFGGCIVLGIIIQAIWMRRDTEEHNTEKEQP